MFKEHRTTCVSTCKLQVGVQGSAVSLPTGALPLEAFPVLMYKHAQIAHLWHVLKFDSLF